MARRATLSILLIALFSAAVLVAAPFTGMQRIGPGALINGGDEAEREILLAIRLPRVCAAFLAGAALALGGAAFQAMFRNPLATPFTLGVSSGAAFGAALYMLLGFSLSFAGATGRTAFAFAWAMAAVLVVYGLTRLREGFSAASMLVAGVAVNFFFSSLILLLQYASDFARTHMMIRWLMGGFDVFGFGDVLRLLPFVLAGSAVILAMSRELNLLCTGEETAHGRGVDVRRVKGALFFATSIMVGSVVSVCGPIGFVGMMVPHICRLLVGPDHRVLGPVSMLFGGAFLVLCDTVARTVLAPAEIPVGVLTALLGGPFFIWLLTRGTADRSMLEES